MRVEYDHARAAAVLPGQSSRDDRMREVVEEWRPQLLDTLDLVVGGDDPFAAGEPSLAAEHALTVCCSLAYWYALGRPTPRYLVGHSLGELTALAISGSISEHDAVRLAAVRGELLQRACEANPGCGLMSVRAPLFDIEAIAEECGVAVAYHNAPRHVVLSGARDGLTRARGRLGENGIRCTSAEPAGAFNSPLMAPAVAPFRAALDDCDVHPPQAIVYSATSCRPMIDMRGELASNLVSPVRWWETLARLAMEGVETFIEVRAGGLLSPLPAGVTERVPRRRSHGRGAEGSDMLEKALDAAADDDGAAVDALFAYHDEENRLHVLV